MKTRSKVFSKAILYVLVAALTLVIYIPVAAAISTTLTTTVPETLPLLLELSGNGTITINGANYTQSSTLEIPRNSTVELQITPDAENKIKSVVYNDCDYTTDAKDGKLTLPAITDEAMLCVSFIKIASTPQTGDAFSPLCLTLLMFVLLMGMFVAFSFRRKKVN